MTYLLVLIFLDFYKKVDLAGELSKIVGGEAKDSKGMNLLYELTQSTNIDCPDKVARLYLMNYYWIWSGMIMGEKWKKFKLDALEVFRIMRKWNESWKHKQTQIK